MAAPAWLAFIDKTHALLYIIKLCMSLVFNYRAVYFRKKGDRDEVLFSRPG